MASEKTLYQTYKETESYKDFMKYLLVSNDKLKSELKTFIKTNSDKRNKDVDNFIDHPLDLETLEDTILHTSDEETVHKQMNYGKNMLHLLCEVIPNIIINKVEVCGKRCKIPKHWKLSEFNTKDLIKVLTNNQGYYNKFFEKESLRKILNETYFKNKLIIHLADLTQHSSNKADGDVIFNSDICRLLYEILHTKRLY